MCERLGMMLAALQLTKVDKVEDTEKVDNALDEPNSLLPINIWMCETYQTFNRYIRWESNEQMQGKIFTSSFSRTSEKENY
ncbi:hypothetical protein SESBI_46096 [Sesbania bispinosa]|nr:hypothetical protein SESBI_46096 [Sesbania bispinosa]